VIVLTAFISPYESDRLQVREKVAVNDFIEVYCDTAIEICEARDVKGLYKKARAGELAEFTGISSPYQIPKQPELTIKTGTTSLNECVQQVLSQMSALGICKN